MTRKNAPGKSHRKGISLLDFVVELFREISRRDFLDVQNVLFRDHGHEGSIVPFQAHCGAVVFDFACLYGQGAVSPGTENHFVGRHGGIIS